MFGFFKMYTDFFMINIYDKYLKSEQVSFLINNKTTAIMNFM